MQFFLKIISPLLLTFNLEAFGQTSQHAPKNNMNYQLITNNVARSAIKAWQDADVTKWLSLFTPGAQLYDDGSPRDFQDFSTHAMGEEYFLSFDKIKDQGNTVYGHFHTKKYGDFKACFHFHINKGGKITRLDISQVNY